MAGRTPEHGAPAGLPKTALNAALRGRPCRVFTSDVRVRVLETDLATYPDASVVCGKLETAPDDRDAIVNPVLIVEVFVHCSVRPRGQGPALPAAAESARVPVDRSGRAHRGAAKPHGA